MRFFRILVLACLVAAGSLTAYAGPVDINSANAEAIAAALKGVGQQKAQAIVAYRHAHGPFKSADDLAMVKGIGTRTIEMNRDSIRIGKPKSR
ncbi:MAG: helix-hairpin-helix domain-containing protein [Gammaproteobacteria bacterium]